MRDPSGRPLRARRRLHCNTSWRRVGRTSIAATCVQNLVLELGRVEGICGSQGGTGFHVRQRTPSSHADRAPDCGRYRRHPTMSNLKPCHPTYCGIGSSAPIGGRGTAVALGGAPKHRPWKGAGLKPSGTDSCCTAGVRGSWGRLLWGRCLRSRWRRGTHHSKDRRCPKAPRSGAMPHGEGWRWRGAEPCL